MPSSDLILCRPLLLLPPIPCSTRAFSNESTLHMRWPKYCRFSFSISPSKEHPGLISFRMNWLDLLAVQRTLKSLLQHHGSKMSILQRSAFFRGFPGGSEGKASACLQCRRPGFDPWVGKILWRRKWQLTPVFLPGKSHGWSLVGYSPWGHKELDTTEQLHFTSLQLSSQSSSHIHT